MFKSKIELLEKEKKLLNKEIQLLQKENKSLNKELSAFANSSKLQQTNGDLLFEVQCQKMKIRELELQKVYHSLFADSGIDGKEFAKLERRDLAELFPGVSNFLLRKNVCRYLEGLTEAPVTYLFIIE